MYKFALTVVFCFSAVIFAQDQAAFKNAVGWESGLSYRRYINNSVWVGVNVTGSYDNSLANDTQFYQSNLSTNDSLLSINASADKDTNKMYSGTIKIELGKEIFKYKKLDIGAYIAAGYTLTYSRTYESRNGEEDGPYLDETKGHSILGIIGFEPKIFLWDRISVGTQLGFQYTYTTSKLTYNNQYNDVTDHNIDTQNRSTFENNFKLFGNISLSSVLVIHYYF